MGVSMPYSMIFEERVEELLSLVLRKVKYMVTTIQYCIEEAVVVALFMDKKS